MKTIMMLITMVVILIVLPKAILSEENSEEDVSDDEDKLADAQDLAEMFAPIIQIHKDNPLKPIAVEYMLDKCTVYYFISVKNSVEREENEDWHQYFQRAKEEIGSDKDSWDDPGISSLYITIDDYDKCDGNNRYEKWEGFWKDNNSKYDETVYYQVYEDANGYPVIQYWFYYPYDWWANKHEGDWERMQVKLVGGYDSNEGKDIEIKYHYHEDEIKVDPNYYGKYEGEDDKIEDYYYCHLYNGTHPLVWVGGDYRLKGQRYKKEFQCKGGANCSGASYPWKDKEKRGWPYKSCVDVIQEPFHYLLYPDVIKIYDKKYPVKGEKTRRESYPTDDSYASGGNDDSDCYKTYSSYYQILKPIGENYQPRVLNKPKEYNLEPLYAFDCKYMKGRKQVKATVISNEILHDDRYVVWTENGDILSVSKSDVESEGEEYEYKPEWLEFPGSWGEYSDFGEPPTGPAHHKGWESWYKKIFKPDRKGVIISIKVGRYLDMSSKGKYGEYYMSFSFGYGWNYLALSGVVEADLIETGDFKFVDLFAPLYLNTKLILLPYRYFSPTVFCDVGTHINNPKGVFFCVGGGIDYRSYIYNNLGLNLELGYRRYKVDLRDHPSAGEVAEWMNCLGISCGISFYL